MKKFYTRKEVAALLGVSKRTLIRWHNLRKGPPRVKVGNFIAYPVEGMNEWFELNEVGPQ